MGTKKKKKANNPRANTTNIGMFDNLLKRNAVSAYSIMGKDGMYKKILHLKSEEKLQEIEKTISSRQLQTFRALFVPNISWGVAYKTTGNSNNDTPLSISCKKNVFVSSVIEVLKKYLYPYVYNEYYKTIEESGEDKENNKTKAKYCRVARNYVIDEMPDENGEPINDIGHVIYNPDILYQYYKEHISPMFLQSADDIETAELNTFADRRKTANALDMVTAGIVNWSKVTQSKNIVKWFKNTILLFKSLFPQDILDTMNEKMCEIMCRYAELCASTVKRTHLFLEKDCNLIFDDITRSLGLRYTDENSNVIDGSQDQVRNFYFSEEETEYRNNCITDFCALLLKEQRHEAWETDIIKLYDDFDYADIFYAVILLAADYNDKHDIPPAIDAFIELSFYTSLENNNSMFYSSSLYFNRKNDKNPLIINTRKMWKLTKEQKEDLAISVPRNFKKENLSGEYLTPFLDSARVSLEQYMYCVNMQRNAMPVNISIDMNEVSTLEDLGMSHDEALAAIAYGKGYSSYTKDDFSDMFQTTDYDEDDFDTATDNGISKLEMMSKIQNAKKEAEEKVKKQLEKDLKQIDKMRETVETRTKELDKIKESADQQVKQAEKDVRLAEYRASKAERQVAELQNEREELIRKIEMLEQNCDNISATLADISSQIEQEENDDVIDVNESNYPSNIGENSKIIVIGGTQKWTSAMASRFPYITFYSVEENPNSFALAKADLIFLNIFAVKHKYSIPAQQLARAKNIPFVILAKSGVNNCSRQIEESYELCLKAESKIAN